MKVVGFTLIEILVSMSILAIFGTALATTYIRTTTTLSAVEAQFRLETVTKEMFDRRENDLASLTSSFHPSGEITTKEFHYKWFSESAPTLVPGVSLLKLHICIFQRSQVDETLLLCNDVYYR